MGNTVKKFLGKIPFLKLIVRYIKRRIVIVKWFVKGKPVPPPDIIKVLAVKYFARKHHYPVLIETGTYLGDMIKATKKNFKKIYSIEIDHSLYVKAKQKFSRDKHIKILEGDSGKILPDLLKEVYEPIIFWLDGHYSGGITGKGELNSPIIKELQSIFCFPNKNVILIDDARCFTGKDDYPTLSELKNFILVNNPNLTFEVIDDIIRIY